MGKHRRSAKDAQVVGSQDRTTGGKSSRSPRGELEQIDHQIIELVTRRAELIAREAQKAQETPQAERRDLWRQKAARLAEQQREMGELIARLELNPPLSSEAVADLMRHVVSLCQAAVPEVRIAYLGPQYSYSHLAAIKCFGDAAALMPVVSISAVFESIVRHDAQAGVVPIENSTDGRVVDTLGMFLKHRVRICGELLLPIHHHLLSRTSRSEITEVYSKPQALSQCRDWLAHNLPTVRLVEMSSTAAAAQLAAERSGAAAVASLQAGERYGLEVVATAIEDNPDNVTRFAILGSEPSGPTGNDKTALLFQVDHKPGALADAMNLFKRGGLNLTWIESFPIPGARSEYLFFVELEGHESDEPVERTIAALTKRAQRLEVLGSYPKSPKLEAEI